MAKGGSAVGRLDAQRRFAPITMTDLSDHDPDRGVHDGRNTHLDGFGADCRFALRLYARRPAVTALVLVTLGLAIGGSTEIYSVVKPALS